MREGYYAAEVPYASRAYSFEAPYAAFVRSPGVMGGFMFSFRQLPYESLSGFHQDYYDWLMGVSTSLTSAIPDKYKHSVDVQIDTIGTLEAFILAALARISPADTDIIRRLSMTTIWQGAAQFSSIIHPDLHPYLFRLVWLWPSNPKPRHQTISNISADSDDKSALDALERMRGRIASRATAELSAVVSEGPTGAALGDDMLVPSVQDALLLALAAQMQFKQRRAVNLASSHLLAESDIILKWRKRFQLLTPELLAFLQRSRYAGSADKTFVPLSARPGVPAIAAVGWLPTGEADYNPIIRRRTTIYNTYNGPRYAVVPLDPPQIEVPTNAITPLPVGARISPAASAVPLVPAASAVYEPTYYAANGAPTPGRTIIAPRPALVANNQAILIGGQQKQQAPRLQEQTPRLFGFDPDAAHKPKKVGGCAP